MGPPRQLIKLVYKWLNAMVYGRYNELVNGDYFMVYKPTNITGGPILYANNNIYNVIPIGSMVLLYMVTWIPSIYPKC
jgi:hypothetical protein